MIKAVIEYHRVGLQGALTLEGLIDPNGPEAECFMISDGTAFAFLIPPPTNAREYLSEFINGLNPVAYETPLTFTEALAELRAGKEARQFFARELAKEAKGEN